MSLHLMQCAALLPLKATEKLALLCLAENANGRDSVAFPGHDALRTWTGLSKGALAAVLSSLVELHLIERVGGGYKGRAAEYLLFPYGCCRGHGKDDTDLPADDAEGPGYADPSPGVKGPVQPSESPGRRDPYDTPSTGFGEQDALAAKGSSDDLQRVRSHAHPKGPRYVDPHQELPPLQPSPGTHLPLPRHDARDLDSDDEPRSAVVA